MKENLALNPTFVRKHMRSSGARMLKIQSSIAAHYESYQGYLAWSGGKDSTVIVDIARRIIPNIKVVWFDSGLEYPDTRDYINALSEKWSLNLTIIPAEPDALTVLKETGVWNHASLLNPLADILHDSLIIKPADKAHSLFGIGELSGLRAEESVGRRALLAKGKGHYVRKDGSLVYAPIWSWSGSEVLNYLAQNDISLNPVYSKLASVGAPSVAQRVGLVVDGNNPNNGRYTYLRLAYPDLWASLCETLPRLKEWR